jgi:hypothetical protein
MNELILMNLRLFAGEAEPDTGTAAEGEPQGEPGNASRENAESPEEDFEALIGQQGKYRDQYQQRVQKAVKSRFRDYDALQGKAGQYDTLMQSMAKRYGITAEADGSIAPGKVLEALDKDSKALAQRAMEKGTTEEAEAEMETMRRQLEEANQREERQKQQARQEQERNALRQQADATKSRYPDFDLQRETENPEFLRLLRSGVDMEHAYLVIHHDDLLKGAVRYAADRAGKTAADNIRARGARPAENAASATAPAQAGRKSFASMTSAEYEAAKTAMLQGGKAPWEK